jgi:hypothetical protein
MSRKRVRSTAATIAGGAGIALLALTIVALSVSVNSQERPNFFVLGSVGVAYAILSAVQWVNRRDDPRDNRPAAPPESD